MLLSYGVNELRLLMQQAIAALVERLKHDLAAILARADEDYYRYGHIMEPRPRSRK
jgi:hypothetical protein